VALTSVSVDNWSGVATSLVFSTLDQYNRMVK
jgi:hypothetical protein